MAETFNDRIINLQQVLPRVAAGTATDEDVRLIDAGGDHMPLDIRLMAVTMAQRDSLLEMIQNRHDLAGLHMGISKYITFFARQVADDNEFWTEEVNEIVPLHVNVLLDAQNEIEFLLQGTDGKARVIPLVQTQARLVSLFNAQQKRRVDELTLYEAHERPELHDVSAETALKFLFEKLTQTYVRGVESLADRATYAARRIHLVRGTILPLFEQAGDPAAPSWRQDMNAAMKTGVLALKDAQDLLGHATYAHGFPARLAQIKTQKP